MYSVDAVIADKYGPQGMYGDAATFGAPFKNSAEADEHLRPQTPFSPQAVEYCKEICSYILDSIVKLTLNKQAPPAMPHAFL